MRAANSRDGAATDRMPRAKPRIKLNAGPSLVPATTLRTVVRLGDTFDLANHPQSIPVIHPAAPLQKKPRYLVQPSAGPGRRYAHKKNSAARTTGAAR